MSTRLMAHMLGLDVPDVDPANSQGERKPNLDSYRRRRKQQQPQQQPMGYPYINNDTMAMWSNVPTGFEYVFVFLFELRVELLIRHYS